MFSFSFLLNEIKSGLLYWAALFIIALPVNAAVCPDEIQLAQIEPSKNLSGAFNACTNAGDFPRALNVALHAKKLATAKNSLDELSTALLFEATALQFMGLYDQALARYDEILHSSGVIHAVTRISSLNNSAVILLAMEQFDAAQQMSEQSITESKAQSDFKLNEHVLYIGTLAAILTAKKDLTAATKMLAECLTLAEQVNSALALVYCRQTQAQLLLSKNLFKEALDAANFAITTAEERRIVSDIANNYLIKASALSQLGKKSEALATAQLGVNIAIDQQDMDSALPIWKFIEQEYVANNQWQPAHAARISADELAQKMFNNKIANALSYQRAQHEYDRQLQEISELKSENELHQAEASTAKAQRTAILLVAALAMSILGFGFFRWMHKRDLTRAEMTNQELRRLHELKDQFLANTSHELRTPLNGIIGLSDLLVETEKANLSTSGNEQLRLIRDCGTQLSDMVDSILDFSQIKAGKNKLTLEATPFTDVIKYVQPILQPLANQKGLQLRLDVPAQLPWLMADATRLRQILINLMGNAIKFTERGFVELSARELPDKRIRISVRDSGIGIPPTRLQSIFEPFEQVDGSLRRRHGGVGLGLAIARELVQAHNSELTVQSTLNVGTEFSFVVAQADSQR